MWMIFVLTLLVRSRVNSSPFVFDVTLNYRDTQTVMNVFRKRLCIIWLALVFTACEEPAMGTLDDTFDPLPVTSTVATKPTCVDDVKWIESTVPRRLSSFEYQNIISDVFGLSIAELVKFPADEETMGFDNNARALQASPIHIERYFEAAEIIAAQAVRMVVPELDCDLNGVSPGCLEPWLVEIGARLWRRPLSNSELTRLSQLFVEGIESDETENEALARILEAFLQSPFFLYRVEIGTPTAQANVFELTDYEVASRLSFLAWRTTPDARLLAAADDGALRTPEGRLEQLTRMLDDPRAEPAWWSFFAQWLHFDDLLKAEKDESRHPDFGRTRTEQYAQARAFTRQHGFAQGSSIEQLLGEPFDLDSDPRHAQRRGVLSLPGWLAVNAKPNMTSPIHRGVFVREQLLCTTLPPPPPEAMVTAPNPDPTLSAREQYEIHRADESCASCHRLIDPVGLVFEHFDEVGRWRDRDNGQLIDNSGEMFGSRDLDGPFEDHMALAEGLSQSEQVHRCFNHQVFRFVFGRGERDADRCWLEYGYDEYKMQGMSLRALLRYYVSAPSFVKIMREGSDGS
jgi:hypothetical protein